MLSNYKRIESLLQTLMTDKYSPNTVYKVETKLGMKDMTYKGEAVRANKRLEEKLI